MAGGGESIDAFPEVDGLNGEEDGVMGGYLEHLKKASRMRDKCSLVRAGHDREKP